MLGGDAGETLWLLLEARMRGSHVADRRNRALWRPDLLQRPTWWFYARDCPAPAAHISPALLQCSSLEVSYDHLPC